MKNKIFVLTIFVLTVTMQVLAAFVPDDTQGVISGSVIDSTSGTPLEYANIVLYQSDTGTQVTGTITDQDGNFRLSGIRPGLYTVTIKFLGYAKHDIESVEVNPAQIKIDLGTVALKPTVLVAPGVRIEGEAPAVEYQIDKKIIHVSKQYTAVSGSAVEVMQNVPSVTVDVEGNVQLRGSTNFMVLIDGRPTVEPPSDVLRRIPAATIENIEIITNPSVKYDPDGTSGIVNVITKKNTLQGINGMVNLNGGLDDKYGINVLLNYKTQPFNVWIGAYSVRRFFPGSESYESRSSLNDTTAMIRSNGNNRRGGKTPAVRGGFDLFLGSRNDLSVGFVYGKHAMEVERDLDYFERTEPGIQNGLYTSKSLFTRGFTFTSVNLDCRHRFQEKGHELSGQVTYDRRDWDDKSKNELLDENGAISTGKRNDEEGPSMQWRLKMDYTLPLWGQNRIEAGIQSRIGRTESFSSLQEFQHASGNYMRVPEYSHEANYRRDIHALYMLYSGEWGGLGWQSGLRGEYTDRSIEIIDKNERFVINRWDFFPSAHVSYQSRNNHQWSASYGRRIQRSNSWFLKPVITWIDAYTVTRGNPALKPEYIDSYELGYQKNLGKNLLSVESYYRITHNKVERVRSVYQPGIILQSIENIGTDYMFGGECMLNMDMRKWWNVNLMGNLYHYRISGKLDGDSFSRERITWTTRINNTFHISGSTRFQLNANYNGPTILSQGRVESTFRIDGAVRQELLEKNLAIIFQISDMFKTDEYEYTLEDANFYYSGSTSRHAPIVMLTLDYNFNHYKSDQKQGRVLENQEIF